MVPWVGPWSHCEPSARLFQFAKSAGVLEKKEWMMRRFMIVNSLLFGAALLGGCATPEDVARVNATSAQAEMVTQSAQAAAQVAAQKADQANQTAQNAANAARLAQQTSQQAQQTA